MSLSQLEYAVIYCRVSTQKQVNQGDGLNSQEACGREVARNMGLEVEAVFPDVVSGAIFERPGFKAMIAFLRKNRHRQYIVILNNIDRIARDVAVHIKIRDAIRNTGSLLVSPNYKFGDDPDSEFVETVNAAQSQLSRRKNALQTLDRMRGRLLNGYWPFKPPIGYAHVRGAGGGHDLVRDEPVATLIQEVLEGFSAGRIESQTEVLSILQASSAYPAKRRASLHLQRVKDILTRPLYAGYIDFPDWSIPLTRGRHDPLITFGMFNEIQERLNARARAPHRPNLDDDFPLRGLVSCAECGFRMTASWSQGNGGSYPYYRCFTQDCAASGKSVRKDKIEGEFKELLKALRPSTDLQAIFTAALQQRWADFASKAEAERRLTEQELAQLDKDTGRVSDRLVDADSDVVISSL